MARHQGLPQGAVPVPAPAGKTIVLDSGKMRVTLSAERPMVLGYELPGGKKLPGDSSGYPLRVRIGRARPDTYRTICLARSRAPSRCIGVLRRPVTRSGSSDEG